MELRVIADNLRAAPGFLTVDESSLAFASGSGGVVSGVKRGKPRARLLEHLSEAWMGLTVIIDLRHFDLNEMASRAELVAASYAERERSEGNVREAMAAIGARCDALAMKGRSFSRAHVEAMGDLLVFYGWAADISLHDVWATCVRAVSAE